MSLEQKINEVVEQSSNFKIVDELGYDTAGKFLQNLVGISEEIEKTFKDSKKKTYEAWQSVIASEKKHIAPVKTAIKAVKFAMSEFLTKKRAAEDEVRKLLEEKARKLEEEKRLQEAINLESQGKVKEAEKVIETPIEVFIPKAIEKKIEGIHSRTDWTWDITDESLIPREYLVVDSKKITAVVKALKEQCNIPGIIVHSEQTIINKRSKI
jgi:leucyl aminopeptidase